MVTSEKAYRINITRPMYCLVLSDTAGGTTYGPVKSFGEAQEIQITPTVAKGELYGNGNVVDSASKLTALKVIFQATKIPVEAIVEIYKHTVTDGVVQEKAGQLAEYIAVGYEVEQTGGKSEYVWLLKGRPNPMNSGVKQSEGNISYSTDRMEIDFVQRISDKMLRFFADLANSDFTESQAARWFREGPSKPVPKEDSEDAGTGEEVVPDETTGEEGTD